MSKTANEQITSPDFDPALYFTKLPLGSIRRSQTQKIQLHQRQCLKG